MLKLFLAVTVGTLIAWFGVYRFINSTSHMPATFSTDELRATKTAEELKAEKKRREEIAANQLPTQESIGDDGEQIIASEVADRKRQETAPERPARNDGDLRAEDALLRRESDVNASDALGDDSDISAEENEEEDEEAEILEEDIVLEKDDEEEEEEEERVRADSDADLQERGNLDGGDRAQSTDANRSNDEKKPAETVTALNVAYALPDITDCAFPDEAFPQVGVLYRPSSFAIKGQSLSNIDQLIRLHRKCDGGKFIVMQNETEEDDADDRLKQLRQDEVKYYLLQRRIPKGDILFSDELQ